MDFRPRSLPPYRVRELPNRNWMMTQIVQAISRHPVAIVVQQHAEESAILRNTRSVLAVAPHVKLHQLRRLDDRVAAHLDGLAVAGDFGWELCEAALERPGAGEVFAAAVRAIEDTRAFGVRSQYCSLRRLSRVNPRHIRRIQSSPLKL